MKRLFISLAVVIVLFGFGIAFVTISKFLESMFGIWVFCIPFLLLGWVMVWKIIGDLK